MLVKLLPDDITKHWDEISEAISKALPPFTKRTRGRMNSILASLLSGKMHCWVVTEYNKDNDITILYALATTEITIDPVSYTKNLLIFSLYAFQPVPFKLWEDGFDTLSKFAKVHECDNILAFTDIPRIEEIVKKIGGSVTSLIKLEV